MHSMEVGRRGGLMVSALVCGSSGRPGTSIVLCTWARHLTLTVPGVEMGTG